MAHISSTSLICLVFLALILYTPPGSATAISCSQAIQYLMPCQPFLLGIGDISSPCCLGAQELAQAASSKADRKLVCQCFKQAAASVNVNMDKAKQLPQLCKITVPVAIQPNVDCDTIPMNEITSNELNRYKNMEMMDFRPTAPGHSPGIGHDSPPPHA